MVNSIKVSFLAIIILVTGCAGKVQYPVALNYSAISENAKVGVVLAPVPESTMSYPGASCLLCLAAAATANSGLSSHAKTLDNSDLSALKDEVVASLKEQGFDVKLIEQYEVESKLPKISSKELNVAKRNHSIYRTKHDVDYLVVIDFNFVGITRNYSSYIPTGDPAANISGLVRMIDLDTHLYTLYRPVSVYKNAEGEWKEPPAYPGMTNAYYQALEDAKDQVKKSVVAIVDTASAELNPVPADGVE